ncbi:hypothetical protein LCGC14_0954320 [marine sediment metagenome]|uniref:Xylose isomerase-like TIM barrel domain-containing protein n=1 Tax=marine sediment metagenome TaxID=412755 RepID=A0A0F9P2F9_9ZZZZ
MKIGVFTALFQDRSFEEGLDMIKQFGIDVIEVGTGGFVGNAHCNASLLLTDEMKIAQFKRVVEERGLFISAFSCHGNPLHPQKAIADKHQQDLRDTIKLAEKLGIERINLFAGCPGDSENSKYPNWPVCPWPDDYLAISKWQWEEKIIPFWQEEVKFARQHGIHKLCFEMHPGDSVHNPEKLLRLREAVGEEIGCNFDPSHLFWQGINPIAAIRKLGQAIYHVHAKDVKIDPFNTSVNGVLDTKHYSEEMDRSWIFRTVGYGHGYEFWKDFVSTLRLIGYDYVLSIEHEDSLMSSREGLDKAVTFLREIMLTEERGKMSWA